MTKMEISVAIETLVAAFLNGDLVSVDRFDNEKVMVQKGVRKALKKLGKVIVEVESPTDGLLGFGLADEPKKTLGQKIKAVFGVEEPTEEIASEDVVEVAPPVVEPRQGDLGVVASDADFEVEPAVEETAEEQLDAELAVALATGPTVTRVYNKSADMVSETFRSLRKTRLGELRVTFAKDCTTKDFNGFPEWLSKNSAKYAAAVMTRVGKEYAGKVYLITTDMAAVSGLVGQLNASLPGYEVIVSENPHTFN